MYALAAAHPGRVALSSTAHMYVYDEARVDHVVETGRDGLDHAAGYRVVAYAGATETRERVGGLTPAELETLWRDGGFDLMLIKADGARARWIKAPADYEPLVVPFADLVVPVVSARVLGRRLGDGIAHRPERAAAVMGTTPDAPLEPEQLARLLTAPDGLLKGVGDARVVPVLNMVDDEALRRAAGDVAQRALARTTRFDRVVLAQLKHARVVQVIER